MAFRFIRLYGVALVGLLALGCGASSPSTTEQQEEVSKVLEQEFEVDFLGPTGVAGSAVGVLAGPDIFTQSFQASSEFELRYAKESCLNPDLDAWVTWNAQNLGQESATVVNRDLFDLELDVIRRALEREVLAAELQAKAVTDPQITGLFAVLNQDSPESVPNATAQLEALGLFDYRTIDLQVKVYLRREFALEQTKPTTEQILDWPEADDIRSCFEAIVNRIPEP